MESSIQFGYRTKWNLPKNTRIEKIQRIFFFLKDIIGGYVHELLRAHAFRTRYTYVYGVLVLAVATQKFVVYTLLERGMHTHI